MNRALAEAEVLHCMLYYLLGIRRECSDVYYRKMKAEALEAAREVLDTVSYTALASLIEEREAEENA